MDTRKAKTGVFSAGRALISDRTLRTDKWWIEPAITFGVFISFIIYATFRAFENKN
jgi:cobalamin biosynthesis protein CobD/CbiB